MTAQPTHKFNRMEERRHELYDGIMQLLQQRLTAIGVSENQALLISTDFVDVLSGHWGGQNFTFPKECNRKLRIKEAEIIKSFNGRNYAELAQRHKMTERGMRKLIERARSPA